MEKWTVNSNFKRDEFIKHVIKLYDEHHYVTFSWTTGRQVTQKQFNAMHLWCERLAEHLNDAGLDMRKMLKAEIEIPWSKDTVKNQLWRPIQIAICGIESTKEADKIDYPKVYETLNRHLLLKYNVSMEWPHE